MFTSQDVSICGSAATIYGDTKDAYFTNVAVSAQQFGPLTSLVEAHVPTDGRIIDIGANIGISAIALSRIRPGAEIFAFEPSPANVGFLRKNLDANGIRNVTVVSSALSNRKGYLPFHEADFGAGSHIVSADHLSRQMPTIDVPMDTLDDFTLQQGGKPFSFVKIDAEGHEPNILAGARAFIARDNPLIHMEFNAWCLNAFGGHSPAAFVKALWKHFEVMEEAQDHCALSATGVDPIGFLHRNLLSHGCVDNVVLRLRNGCAVPLLEEMTWPTAALEARLSA